jgi:hypothetical protein
MSTDWPVNRRFCKTYEKKKELIAASDEVEDYPAPMEGVLNAETPRTLRL